MGKQIRIYLADGTSTGIRHAEITNWSGQALACPRSRFTELKELDEVRRPGVYFLFGTSEDSDDEAVYIGESEVVLDRLSSHISGKDFWSELIAFTSKDDNLTKGHVKYLESRLIQLATAANRYRVTNTALPQPSPLPRADRDAMDEYLVSVRSLLGVLGHRVLDPYAQPVRAVIPPNTSNSPPSPVVEVPITSDQIMETPSEAIFTLRIGSITATAARTDEGLVVLASSEAAEGTQSSLSGGYRALREKLVASGTLAPANGKLMLTKDYLFKSPSQAAAVLVGYAINGRDAWRRQDGTTFGAYEQQLATLLLKQLGGKQ
jgi:Domain of unknown function (DUF4357)